MTILVFALDVSRARRPPKTAGPRPAEQVFGREHIEERIHLHRRKCTPAAPPSPTPSVQTAARALCLLGFKEPDVRRALVLVETKLDTRLAPVDTIVREALLVLT
jgi:Holliday junction resolvasome RuvABC DNA-binding subunit